MSTAAVALHVPFLDLKREYQFLRTQGIEETILSTLEQAHFVEGRAVEEFELAFAEYCGAKEAVAVDSGTAALHLAMLSLGIGLGDEVVVPVHTFIATAAAVALVGARPIFVDADPRTWQMDLEQLPHRIGPKCKAIVAVHLYGQPLNMDKLMAICGERNVALIEDGAQAHGARYGEKRVGSFGTISCFSFYPTKNLAAFGDGGAVLTQDPKLAARVRRLRNHGRVSRYEHSEVGYNYRMDELQGRVLNTKLGHLDKWNARRRELVRKYCERLKKLPLFIPKVATSAEPVYHLFPVGLGCRDELALYLREHQIETGVYYPVPLHLQPAFRSLGHSEGDFPVAERIAKETLSLPLHPFLTDDQADFVCRRIGEFFEDRHS